jgi:phosphoribosylglycinamide formyltransferase-1
VKRILLLASGSGTLAAAIIKAVEVGEIQAEIVGLISDQVEAGVVGIANENNIEVHLIPMLSDRAQWDDEMLSVTTRLAPDLVVSAGFMRILNKEYVETFKVLNSHPALLPAFPGAHAVRDALAAGASKTGTTIHWVDAGMDTGPVIAQTEVDVIAGDTEESLHERIKIVERGLIVATISEVLSNSKVVDNG